MTHIPDQQDWQPPEFKPLIRNPHLATLLANFWPREFDFSSFPVHESLIETEPGTQVLVHSQSPIEPSRGNLVLVHGLEGGASAGYMVSLAYCALRAGFAVHRFHMRTCGDTAHLCSTLYHAGLTSDLRVFLETLPGPIFLTGFSLGGNVCLKLAGELGEQGWLRGVCAVSTPIDLAAATRRMQDLENRIYERRFLKRMRARIVATGRYQAEDVERYQSLYAIDDAVTAPSFGFGTADNYYATQSSKRFLGAIRVPALLIQAEDDTFMPFAMFSDPAIAANPHLRLLALPHGGHLGFLSRRGHRFWLDEAIVSWLNFLTP